MIVMYIGVKGVAEYSVGVAAAGGGVERGYSTSIQACPPIG